MGSSRALRRSRLSRFEEAEQTRRDIAAAVAGLPGVDTTSVFPPREAERDAWQCASCSVFRGLD